MHSGTETHGTLAKEVVTAFQQFQLYCAAPVHCRDRPSVGILTEYCECPLAKYSELRKAGGDFRSEEGGGET
jgi:hypothetical protein